MAGATTGRIGMRLIDSDAMKDTNNNVIAVIDPETKSKYWISLNDYINAQPTVDTIKHAHWVRVAKSENEYWQCSNCHGYFTLPMPKYRGFYMRYCGCCGAEMDEVTE